jgi:hypothetical protein
MNVPRAFWHSNETRLDQGRPDYGSLGYMPSRPVAGELFTVAEHDEMREQQEHLRAEADSRMAQAGAANRLGFNGLKSLLVSVPLVAAGLAVTLASGGAALPVLLALSPFYASMAATLTGSTIRDIQSDKAQNLGRKAEQIDFLQELDAKVKAQHAGKDLEPG